MINFCERHGLFIQCSQSILDYQYFWMLDVDFFYSQIGDFAILLKSGFRRWDAAVGQVWLY